MESAEVRRIINALSEVFRKVGEMMKELVNSLSKIFDSLKPINKKTHKIPIRYYRPPRNQYLKGKTHLLYKAERKIQRHLPYQRRIY